MQLIDHGLAALLIAGLPLYAAVTYRRLLREIALGQPRARLLEYRLTIAVQWSLVAVALAAWFVGGRTAAELGLALPIAPRSLLGLGVTAAGLGFLGVQWRAMQRLTPEREASLRAQLAPVADLLPRTAEEAAGFRQLAVTAGICEEILYRGFLIWYLASAVGSWPAAVIAGVLFGAAHFYQGAGGVLKTGGVGILTGVLYVATGSLLWPMVLHAGVDLQGGAIARRLLAAAPATAPVPPQP